MTIFKDTYMLGKEYIPEDLRCFQVYYTI